MAFIGWHGCLSDDAVFCSDARARLDNRASAVRSLAIATALVERSSAHSGWTRGHVLWAVQLSWRPVWLSGPLARGLVGLG